MLQHWNDRYAEEAYAYGEEPNEFLKSELDKLIPGKILFPADGEGRNSVYAATKGWDTKAFDQSEEGKRKAMELARKKGVDVDYVIEDIYKLPYPEAYFDVMALIYAHFPADLKSDFHKQLMRLVKPGGLVIFEAFCKDHLEYVTRNPKVGGPKEIGMLFSKDELLHDFSNCEVLMLEEVEVELKEGVYHNGVGKVIRFIGKKL